MLETNSVPGEQGQAVDQSNTGNQTVAHSDLLARTVTLAANICRVSGGSTLSESSNCVGNDHRQLSRSSFVVRTNSSPSFFESEPPSDNRVLRRFSRSTSHCKKRSVASAKHG